MLPKFLYCLHILFDKNTSGCLAVGIHVTILFWNLPGGAEESHENFS
jgi:hypothetical protein